MSVGFASFEIARSGLFVNERGLYVTGHNISNVNTAGYVRQQAMITTGPYHTVYGRSGMYQLGLGADIQQIRQIRHTFLDNIYRQENINLGYWEARSKTFQDVQAILAEPMGSGLQGVMNQFWDSWHELSKEPDSLTVRALVRQRGEALVHHINHMGTQLDKLQNDLDSEIRVRIDEVNRITRQIADLNVAILKTEVTGDTANDYRDQRNTLVDRLSKLVNAEAMELQDGQLAVTLGGYFLVNKGVQTRIYAGEGQPGTMFNVPKLEGTDIEVPLRGGLIEGLMESRGEVSGAKWSIGNGTPDTRADITFVIDVSDSGGLYIEDIKSKVKNYVAELEQRGVDYNINLITTFNNTYEPPVHFNKNNIDDFISTVDSISTQAGAATTDFTNVLNEVGSLPFRPDENKYLLLFTNDDVTAAEADGYNSILSNSGIKASIITDTVNSGWDMVAEKTGGRLYEDVALAVDVGRDINGDINKGISTVEETSNIISDLKRRLNALINIMAREVNYLQRSGQTLGNPSLDGQDFFVPINPDYPMGMRNVRLNPVFAGTNGLNHIVTSESGASGDNIIALNIANLRHDPVMRDITGILSMDDYYQSIILNVGHYGSDAARITENQLKLVQSADSFRQSVTGVSMDEEMTNMMKYKFAYGASSRAINIIDEMLETVIKKMGLAGR
jgi:flagellar hook-associated protein 1 FlgK